MAIVKFEQEASPLLSNFKAWLDLNKAGTFLENITMQYVPSSSSSVLKLGKRNFEIELDATDSTGSGKSVIYYRGQYTSLDVSNKSGSNYSKIRLTGAILCSRALILSYQNSGSSTICHRIMITTDSQGDLAVIAFIGDFYNFSGNTTKYGVITYDSPGVAYIDLKPQFGANKTSFAPVAPIAATSERTIPGVYGALTTQLSGEGLQSVLKDGVPYITNGIWYAKDGD